MFRFATSLLFGAGIACASHAAIAQENNLGPPEALGEFELLYRIVYLSAPAVSVESAAGSTHSTATPLHDALGTATVPDDGSPPPTPCREI